MNILPKIKKCPNCESINFLRINGIVYENEFQTLKNWTLKNKVNCRKCRIEIGLFINNNDKTVKFIWMDFIRCEENYLKKLIKLQKYKEKYKENSKEKEFAKTIKEIQSIQNQIRLDQVKLKIKAKIENRLLI
jgi:hypothetical protein